MVEPDTIIDGRYRVVSRLGSGGMADVYLAEDQLLGRQVAVKLLHHHFAEDQEFVERFRREASSAAALSHQNIVAIFDRGSWQGTYYIAMEYVAGRSLKSLVREQGALDPASAIDIVVQILRAARFAHKRGVIHRDLKPHNVILDEEGRARVTDFGIARAGASDMTLTGSIMGTAQYLSPEQAQGYAVSAASDLYSIGVILYELLTGIVPFEGETAVAIAFKQVSAAPRPPSELNPAVPPGLDAIVLRALAKDPAQRFADADEFIVALQRERAVLPAAAGAAVLAGAPLQKPGFGDGLAAPGGAVAPGGDGGPPVGPLMLPPEGGLADDDDDGASGQHERPAALRWVLWALAVLALAAAVAAAIILIPTGNRTTVPNVIGQGEQAASLLLKREHLQAAVSQAPSSGVPAGFVISQSPAPASHVARGSRVGIVVSSGPASIPVEDVEGLTASQAMHKLTAAGFRPTSRSEPSATVAAGRVIGTEPSAGTDVKVGSSIAVLVSSGPQKVHVPDVVGESRSAAEASLTNAGLMTGTVSSKISSQAPGTVLSQSPHAGTSLREGAGVNLVVAKASNEATVPSVVGQNETQAAATLGGGGFTPRIVTLATTQASQVGVVLKQSPAAGRHVRKGATVTLTVGALSTSTTPTTVPTTTTTTPTTTPTTTTSTGSTTTQPAAGP